MCIRDRKPTLSLAIFPREQYLGTLTTDLFADDETTYFDDVDQFLALQKQAVNVLAEERRKTAAWVEEFYLYTVPWWQFREAREDVYKRQDRNNGAAPTVWVIL